MAKILYISIGNEILMGKTVNMNEAYIGEHLFSAGFYLDTSFTIGDDRNAISRALSYAQEQYNVTIITGGLGPTHDDITKETVASFFNKNMQFREDVWNEIETRYRKHDKAPPEVVRSQAEVPDDFIVIKNDHGTAPGLHYSCGKQHFFILPGVPREMQPMIKNYVIPTLKKTFSSETLYQETIRTFGLFESELYDSLKDIHETPSTKIAFLPKTGMVDIRLFGSRKDEIKKIKERIERNINVKNIYGYNDHSLVDVLHDLMIKNGKTLSAAESCTGGLIQSMITDNAGSSEYFLGGVVSYSNHAKMKLLGVQESTLEKWGAVSEQTVKEMLDGSCKLFGSDYAIVVSGVAGPGGGTEDKPVGLVFIGSISNENHHITNHFFSGSRTDIKKQTANHAIYQMLINLKYVRYL